MTRTEMEPAARERLLEAALVALAEEGREALDPAGLAARSGVAEAELVAEFGDLEGCVDAAYGRLTRQLADAVRAGCERGRAGAGGAEAWPAGVRGGLEALLGELAASPARAVALMRSYPARGAVQRSRYEEFVGSFGPLLAEGRRVAAGGAAKLPEEVELLAAGAAEAIVFEAVEAGRSAELAEMTPAILFSLLVPFLGAEAAGAEMEKARRGR